jgi:hypothetical protein
VGPLILLESLTVITPLLVFHFAPFLFPPHQSGFNPLAAWNATKNICVLFAQHIETCLQKKRKNLLPEHMLMFTKSEAKLFESPVVFACGLMLKSITMITINPLKFVGYVANVM